MLPHKLLPGHGALLTACDPGPAGTVLGHGESPVGLGVLACRTERDLQELLKSVTCFLRPSNHLKWGRGVGSMELLDC